MTEEREALQQAVEHLYTVFARYPIRQDTEACPCCHESGDEPRLHSKPLRELTDVDLEEYAWSALLTWGTVEDFKHFLPRMFELLTESGLADTEVVLAKLRYGEWEHWPENEQRAVEDYLRALWCSCLTDVHFATTNDDILCAIAQATDDLSWFLDKWRASDLVGHYLLARAYAEEARCIKKKRELSNPFWEERPAQMQQVLDWFVSPATKDEIELAYLEYSSDPLAVDIVAALETIEMYGL